MNSALSSMNKGTPMELKLPNFDQAWNYRKPLESRARFEQILQETQSIADLSYIMQLKTQIARTYSLNREYKEAHELLDEIQLQLTNTDPLTEVRYLLERGRTYNSSGEKSKSVDQFEKAFYLGKEIEPLIYVMDAIHMIGIAVSDLGEKEKWYNLGIAEAEKSADPKIRDWKGNFLYNLGVDYFNTGKHYEVALKKFVQSKVFYIETGYESYANISKWFEAKTLRMMGEIDKSLELQLELLKDKNGKDEYGYTFEELGELYLIKEDREKYQFYFKKAYEILSLSPQLQAEEKPRLGRMKELAEL